MVIAAEAAPVTLVGGGSPVVPLLDTTHLEFHTTNVSEHDLAQISPGQSAVVTLKAYPDDPTEAAVVQIGLQAGVAVGDAAGGSKVCLLRLVEHLKGNDVIAEEAEITEPLDLFEAIQHSASQSATAVDAPPLSREELATMADDLKGGYGQAFGLAAGLMPQLDDVWEGMEQLARQENISAERLGGLMTVDAVSWIETSAGLVPAVGQVGALLFDEHMLDSYRRTLAAPASLSVGGT